MEKSVPSDLAKYALLCDRFRTIFYLDFILKKYLHVRYSGAMQLSEILKGYEAQQQELTKET